MRIDAVTDRSYLGPDRCLTGVSAVLAEAREVFRRSAPTGMSWADVTAQAQRIRAQEPMTLIQALHVVFDRIAVGHVETLGPPRA